MNSSCWMSRSRCAATTLVFAGCMAPGPYTYGTYPGYYAPPPGYAPGPGAPIMTPGPSFPPPQLGPAVTPTPAWQPSPSPTSPPLSPTPSLGPSSPPSTPPGNSTFDGPAPFNNSGARKPTDIQVPLPPERDPPSMAPGGPSPGANSTNSPFGSDGSQGTFEKGAQLTIPQRLDGPVQAVATVDPQTFESPIENERHGRDGLVAVSAKANSTGPVIKGSDPCDYDHVSYSWLRGIVDFDSRDNSWHIIYSQHPDLHDHYGGVIRLIGSPKLSTLHSGDVVYVEGRIDTHQLDSRGKPQYRIEGGQLARIGPGPAIQSMGN